MAVHLLRDFNTTISTTRSPDYAAAYILALFLRRVLNYSFVGHTNYDINTISTFLISTGDSTPTAASPTWNPTDRASIALNGANVEVTIPVGIRTVSSADNARVLVLKSTANPTYNSGAFKITSFNAGTNSYIIDYRTATAPISETQTIEWYLYEDDTLCPQGGSTNAGAGYRSSAATASDAPRVILQSPHASGWQVRICHESTSDWSTNNTTMPITIAPGFGGDANGDFAISGQHLHGIQFHNASTVDYRGLVSGWGSDSGTSHYYRVYAIGDSDGYACNIIGRRNADGNTPNSFINCFGIPENEPTPLPPNNIERLYSLGSAYPFNGGVRLNNISFTVEALISITNTTGGISGVAFDLGKPVFVFPCMLTPVNGSVTAVNGGPHASTSAGDCPLLGYTEVMPVDLISGTFEYIYSVNTTHTSVASIIPRFMGTIRHARMGRSNFGIFTTSTDSGRSWIHLRNGVYIPWNGPATVA